MKAVILVLAVMFSLPLVAKDGKGMQEALKYYYQGMATDSAADLAKAENMLDELITVDGKNHELPYYLSSALYHRAAMSMDDKTAARVFVEKAIVMVKKSIRLNRVFSDSHRLFADCLNMKMSLDDFRSANVYERLVFQELALANRLDPRNPAVFVSYGVSYVNRSKLNGGGFTKAEKYLEKALELDENCYLAYYWLGIIYRKTGRLTDALESLDKAVAIAPGPLFAKKERERVLKERDDLKRYNEKIVGSIKIEGVSPHEVMGRVKTMQGAPLDAAMIALTKRNLAEIHGVQDLSVEISESQDGMADINFRVKKTRSDITMFRASIIHAEPLIEPSPTETTRDHIPIFSLILFKQRFFHDDLSALFVLTNYFQQVNFKAIHIGNTPLNLDLDYRGTLYYAGKTKFTAFDMVQNSYDAHDFRLEVMPGIWIVDKLLNLSVFHAVDYQLFLKNDIKTMAPRQLPKSGFIDVTGAKLCFNTLYYLGNKAMEGSYAAFTAEFSRPGWGSRSMFERYSLDLQHNIFFPHDLRLFLMLRGGIARGINSTEEETRLYYIGGGRQAMAKPDALTIHGFYDREYEANDFIMFNIGFRFPLFWKFAMELDADYGYIADQYTFAFGRRHVLGSSVNVILDINEHLTAQAFFGYGYNSKRKSGHGYEIGGKVEGNF